MSKLVHMLVGKRLQPGMHAMCEQRVTLLPMLLPMLLPQPKQGNCLSLRLHVLCVCFAIITCYANLHNNAKAILVMQGMLQQRRFWPAMWPTKHNHPCLICDTILPSTSTLADLQRWITARMARTGRWPLLRRLATPKQLAALHG